MMPTDYVREYYRERLRQQGDGPRGADWRDSEAQDGRLQALLSHVDQTNAGTILDVGCGTGRMAELLLREHRSSVGYTGVDLVPEAIQMARLKFGDTGTLSFLCGSLEAVGGVYDYVLASGIFNVRQDLADETWEEHMALVAAAMRQRCLRKVAFNVLSDAADRREERLYYLSQSRAHELFSTDDFVTTFHESVNRFDFVVCQERRS